MPRNVFNIFVGALLLSFAAPLFKMTQVPPTVAAFYRCLYACPMLFVLSYLLEKRPPARRSRGWLKFSMIAGIVFATNLWIWHRSILYVGTGPATLIGNVQVVWVALFSVVLYRVWPQKIVFFLLPVIFFGLWLAMPPSRTVISLPLGIATGLGSALQYAIFLTCLHYAKSRYPDMPVIRAFGITTFMTALFSFIFVLMEGTLRADIGIKSHLMLLLLAIVVQVLGWLVVTLNYPKVPIYLGSVILLAQPLASMVWGNLLFGEPFAAVQILGCIIALAAIYGCQRAVYVQAVPAVVSGENQ